MDRDVEQEDLVGVGEKDEGADDVKPRDLEKMEE